MEFAAAFSGGKDSVLAIKKYIDKGNRLIGLIVSNRKEDQLSWSHSIDKKYYEKIAEIFRCDLYFTNTNVEDYEKNFEKALKFFRELGARACVFGDFGVKKHLKWNFDRCKNENLLAVHPMIYDDSLAVVNEFLETGMDAQIIKVDDKLLPSSYIGVNLTKNLLDKITNQYPELDPCGENGEYHTKVSIESIENFFRVDAYLDNASTCYPKAPGVSTRLGEFIDNESFSINRGTYMKSYNLSSKIIDIRDKLLNFIDAPSGSEVIFSPSATEAINVLMKGLTRGKDKILIDDRNHNSVWRVAEHMRKNGDISKLLVWKADNGIYKVEQIIKFIGKSSSYIVLNLVDNVSGRYLIDCIDDYSRLLEHCKENNIYIIADASQAICERKFSMKELGFDAMIFSAHIGMMGTEGLGFMVLNDKIKSKINPLIHGGTGSKSNEADMPNLLPDRLEAGTLNHPAIFGASAAIEYIERKGLENIIEKKHKLANILREELSLIDGLKVFGHGSFVCVSSKKIDDSSLSFNLDLNGGIMNRVGIHCSKLSHESIGDYPDACIRLSLGYFNNIVDVKRTIDEIKKYH